MKHIENGVITYPDGRQICQNTAAGVREYKKRTDDMRLRQESRCPLCMLWLRPWQARFDHEDGRGMGGAHRCDKILHADGTWKNASLCDGCNTEKGSKRYKWENGMYIPVTESVYESPDAGPIWDSLEVPNV